MSAFPSGNSGGQGGGGGDGLAEAVRQLAAEQARTNQLLEDIKRQAEELTVTLPQAIAEQLRAAATG